MCKYTCSLHLWHAFIILLDSADIEGFKCLSGFILCDILTHSPILFPARAPLDNPINKIFCSMLQRGAPTSLKSIVAFALWRLGMKLESTVIVMSFLISMWMIGSLGEKWKSLGHVRLCDYSPWNSPGQNTGAIPFSRGIFPTQGWNPGLPHCRQIVYQMSHGGSLRILELVAYPFSSGSSHPRNWTRVSCFAGGFFYQGHGVAKTKWLQLTIRDKVSMVFPIVTQLPWIFVGVYTSWLPKIKIVVKWPKYN